MWAQGFLKRLSHLRQGTGSGLRIKGARGQKLTPDD